jgi:hypothetical protein
MKKFVRSLVLVAMVCLAGVMAGCGGGGGTTAGGSTTTTGGGTPASTETKLTLSVGSPPAGTLIGAMQGTITLPEGFSVRTVGTTEQVQSDAFTAAGNAASSSVALASFKKATQTVTFGIINASGIPGGDFATLLVQPPAGATVNPAAFTLSGTQVIDSNSTPLNLAISIK